MVVIMKTRNIFMFMMLIFISQQGMAVEEKHFTVGAKFLAGGWEASNSDFDSSEGGQFGFNVSMVFNKLYFGANMQSGDFTFSGNAPDQYTTSGTSASSDVKIKQSELDLLAGYYITPQISLFIDLKIVSNDWLNEAYKQDFGGLGLGIAGFMPLKPKWTLFGSFGFIGSGDITDSNEVKVGEGSSTALEVGAVYEINQLNYLSMGVKLKGYSFEALDNTKQDYSISALFVGFNHSFNL
jgi:hypothetical protein